MPSSRQATWFILALGLLAFFAGLGSRGLWIPDETRYALVARDMVDSGDWLHLKLVGLPYPDKPVGCFWVVGAIAKITGLLNEWTVRLPSALLGLGCLWLLHALGRRLFDARIGFLSALVFGTTWSVVVSARSFMFDVPLTFWVLATMAVLWRILSEDRQRLWAIFGVLCGLGILTKGHNGLILPTLAGLAYTAGEGRWRCWRGFPLALAAALGVVALWLGPAAWTLGPEKGPEFLSNLIFRQGLTRFNDPWDHDRPFYWYLGVYPLLLFPWAIYVPRALVEAFRLDDPLHSRRRFLAAWILAPFVFFSLSKSKGYFYLLPTLPAAALLVAEHLDRRIRTATAPAGPPLVSLAAILLGAGAFGVWIALDRAPELVPAATAVAVASAVGAAATMSLWRRAPARGLALAPALASFLVLATFCVVVVPVLDREMSPRDLVRRSLARLRPGDTFTTYTVDRRYFEFYAPRERFTPTPGNGTAESFVMELHGPTFCLIERKALPKIRKWGRWEILDRQGVRFRETWLLVSYEP